MGGSGPNVMRLRIGRQWRHIDGHWRDVPAHRGSGYTRSGVEGSGNNQFYAFSIDGK